MPDEQHRFTKSAKDHACGALVLVRSRIAEHKNKHGAPPLNLVLHVTVTQLMMLEFAEQNGLPPLPMSLVKPGGQGKIDGVPFFICPCGQPLGEDLVVDQHGNAEPL